MSTNLCLQNRELLGRYSEVLEYLRDLETDLEDYDVSEVRRELVRSEAKLYRLYHELYETIAYQRNHAEALRTRGDFDEYEVPTKDVLYLAAPVRTNKDGEKEYLNIHGEVIDGYLSVRGDLRRGAGFGEVRSNLFHVLNAEGERVSGEEFPLPQTDFVRGVAVVQGPHSLNPYLVSAAGEYLTPPDTYLLMRMSDYGFVEARLSGGRGYHILNARGEVILEAQSVISVEWGVALIEDGDDEYHYVDLETGQKI